MEDEVLSENIEQVADVQIQEEVEVNETETNEINSSDIETEQKNEEEKDSKQTKEDNSKYAAARREAEKELKELRQKNEELNKRNETFAKSLGYNSFEALENAQRKQSYIDQGYDDQVAEKLSQVDIKLQQMEAKESKIRIADEKSKLQDKRFFKELESEIDKYLETNPTLPVEVVFNFVRGQNIEKLIDKESKAATQRQLNNINGKSHMKNETGGVDTDGVHIDEDEWNFYKGLNPKAKREEYSKFIKSQRS